MPPLKSKSRVRLSLGRLKADLWNASHPIPTSMQEIVQLLVKVVLKEDLVLNRDESRVGFGYRDQSHSFAVGEKA